MNNQPTGGLGFVVKLLPWAKITAPTIPVLVIEIFTWNWLFELYKFNVENEVSSEFPNSGSFLTFFICSLVIIFCYLIMSFYHLYHNVKKLN